MNSIVPSVFRASAAAVRITQQRALTTTCSQSISRLNQILEDYRTSHYAQELPRRFRKDIVDAACKRSESSPVAAGIVSAAGIEGLLSNIGAADKMTHDEIETMLREIGSDGNCVISKDKMFDLLSNRVL